MSGNTHALTALTLAGAIISYKNNGLVDLEMADYLFATASTVGGILVDIDSETSTFSRLFSMSYAVYSKSRHRTFWHTILCAILVSLPMLLIPTYGLPLCIGLFIGYLSHLVLDCFNETGVMLFYPFFKEYISFGKIRGRSMGEYKVMFCILTINYLIIDYFNSFRIFNYAVNFIKG